MIELCLADHLLSWLYFRFARIIAENSKNKIYFKNNLKNTSFKTEK